MGGAWSWWQQVPDASPFSDAKWESCPPWAQEEEPGGKVDLEDLEGPPKEAGRAEKDPLNPERPEHV